MHPNHVTAPTPAIHLSAAEYAELLKDRARLEFLLAGNMVETEHDHMRRFTALHYKPTRQQVDAAMPA